MRSDRKRGDQKLVTQTVGGNLDFEMSPDSFEMILAAAMCADWDGDLLTVGTQTTKFEVLKSYLDADKHVLMKGMEIGQLSLDMQSASRITGQIQFAGTEADPEFDPSSESFDDAESTMIFDSSNNLSDMTINGDPVNGMVITGMGLDINNNHQSDQGLGTQFQEHWKGSADITGSKTIRMSQAAYELWKNTLTNQPIATTFRMGDDEKAYEFKIEREFLSGDLPSGGLDEILSFEMDTTVATDSAGQMLSIERIDLTV